MQNRGDHFTLEYLFHNHMVRQPRYKLGKCQTFGWRIREEKSIVNKFLSTLYKTQREPLRRIWWFRFWLVCKVFFLVSCSPASMKSHSQRNVNLSLAPERWTHIFVVGIFKEPDQIPYRKHPRNPPQLQFSPKLWSHCCCSVSSECWNIYSAFVTIFGCLVSLLYMFASDLINYVL